jgi:hypothetical protein
MVTGALDRNDALRIVLGHGTFVISCLFREESRLVSLDAGDDLETVSFGLRQQFSSLLQHLESKLNHKIQYKNIHNPERQSTVNHKIQYKKIHNPERQSTVSHIIQYKKTHSPQRQ